MVSRGHVQILEVGPRDGLQNESVLMPPKVRADLVDRLAGAGLRRIEAASMVRDDLVPAMAEAGEVMASIHRVPGAVYSVLVLNERGFERALRAGADEIHYSFACTDAFARANQNSSVEAGVEIGLRLLGLAQQAGVPLTVTFSVAFGCPFAGVVDPVVVLRLAERLRAQAPAEIVLADTIGIARPAQVGELVRGLVSLDVPTGVHLHDTRGMAAANAYSALEAGAVGFDASVGGAGGCPFAPGATGNMATEDLVYLLEGMGVPTGVDLEALVAVSAWLEARLGHDLPSRVARALRSRA